MTDTNPKTLDEAQLDAICGGSDPETNYDDGPKVFTRHGWVSGRQLVDEIGALMRTGMSATAASSAIEDEYMPLTK